MNDHSFTSSVPKLNVQGVFELLQNPNTHATTLLTICLVMYGSDTFKSDPILLFKWLRDDFGTDLHEFNENKIQATISALGTDYFFQDLQTFKSVCKTLLSGDSGVYDDALFESNPTIPEILWGIYEVSLMREDTNETKIDFSPVIKNFITIILDHTASDDDGDINIDPQTTVVKDEIQEIRQELTLIGMKEIPNFPTIAVDV